MNWAKNWRQRIEERYLAATGPLCELLAGMRVPPNAVTAAGFVISAAAGFLYGAGHFFLAGIVFLLAGACDTIDGRLARKTGRNTDFGAFFDSTLDRLGEISIFSGLAFFYATHGQQPGIMVVVCVLALSGSLMVSYTRARAEGLGMACSIGLMQRSERMAVLIFGSLLAPLPFVGAFLFKMILAVLAVLSVFSALQRMVHVYRQIPQ